MLPYLPFPNALLNPPSAPKSKDKKAAPVKPPTSQAKVLSIADYYPRPPALEEGAVQRMMQALAARDAQIPQETPPASVDESVFTPPPTPDPSLGEAARKAVLDPAARSARFVNLLGGLIGAPGIGMRNQASIYQQAVPLAEQRAAQAQQAAQQAYENDWKARQFLIQKAIQQASDQNQVIQAANRNKMVQWEGGRRSAVELGQIDVENERDVNRRRLDAWKEQVDLYKQDKDIRAKLTELTMKFGQDRAIAMLNADASMRGRAISAQATITAATIAANSRYQIAAAEQQFKANLEKWKFSLRAAGLDPEQNRLVTGMFQSRFKTISDSADSVRKEISNLQARRDALFTSSATSIGATGGAPSSGYRSSSAQVAPAGHRYQGFPLHIANSLLQIDGAITDKQNRLDALKADAEDARADAEAMFQRLLPPGATTSAQKKAAAKARAANNDAEETSRRGHANYREKSGSAREAGSLVNKINALRRRPFPTAPVK